MSISRTTEPRAGFTLVEVAISIGVVGVLMAAALTAMSEGTRAAAEQTVREDLMRRGHEAITRIALHLRNTERDKVVTTDVLDVLEADRLTFQANMGWDETVDEVRWSGATAGEEYVYTREGSELVLYINRAPFISFGAEDQRVVVTTDVTSFAVTPPNAAPLTQPSVTITLAVARTVGRRADGTAEVAQVTLTRTVFVRDTTN